MENQHRKIKGYRELSQEEIDLMNRIKAKGAELLQLQSELAESIQERKGFLLEKVAAHKAALDGELRGSRCEAQEELDLIAVAEPSRWASIGKTDIQTGIMALVRAVAKPTVC
ncbi:Acb2/Tad1 domain-containing protein [Serratia fonticola]|uniref:Acb2/Tad1 domain-containing protein n=1 Tax=Serratia fonticola TaxID=47917 RepID=UPI0034C67247